MASNNPAWPRYSSNRHFDNNYASVEPEEFHYRIRQPASGLRPGFHRSIQIGSGDQFREYGSLLRQPDPRRLDLRASLRDPLQQLQVRIYNQRSTLTVCLLADLTASMSFGGTGGKLRLLTEIAASIALSAFRTGDAFAFYAADTILRQELLIPPTRRSGLPWQIAGQLYHAAPAGNHARGMLAAVQRVPARTSLIFLVSDFHWPNDLLHEVLGRLSGHIVVPLVSWSAHEYVPAATFGLVAIRDLESGQRRLLLARPGLRARLTKAQHGRRSQLHRTFVSHGHEPVFFEGHYDPRQLTEYFLARG
ncbi:hypothetical protein J2T55_000146 [Methylohalomonas lacus]|uniref:DUF58 domain-containing protein n=1 Tax=Methylohalomonas lacus TaxID=398773 RepID=A0AAE3L0A6_9GAMM|nr:DUF58 domain-containing protein [Methylohalomonas lacus]MCS3902154.1 hypothetical protein [Methylohalomonas lacus]